MFAGTARPRHVNLVMRGRTTESRWQQTSGKAMIDALAGAWLASVAAFSVRASDGRVSAAVGLARTWPQTP